MRATLKDSCIPALAFSFEIATSRNAVEGRRSYYRIITIYGYSTWASRREILLPVCVRVTVAQASRIKSILARRDGPCSKVANVRQVGFQGLRT